MLPIHSSIPLHRSDGVEVNTLLGSFGCEVREVRITAALGYLIARAPRPFCEFFDFPGNPVEVHLERRDSSGGRTDIIVRTSQGEGLVEAKIDGSNASGQAIAYTARWKVVLSNYAASVRERANVIGYRNWNEVATILHRLKKSSDREIAVVSKDLLRYLCDHNMSTASLDESPDIYARELNTVETFDMFLHAHVYGCEADRSEIRRSARYFAPYIAHDLAVAKPFIGEGFTFVARILKTVVVDDLDTMLIECSKVLKGDYSQLENILKAAGRNFQWEKRQHLLFLGEPRRAFWPPIHKRTFQKTPGNLSKRSFSFDQLFAMREKPHVWQK